MLDVLVGKCLKYVFVFVKVCVSNSNVIRVF